MEDTLSLGARVTGLRQTQKAVLAGRAARVFLANDADPERTEPIRRLCQQAGVPVEAGLTMARLGRMCRIDVGCAAAAELKSL